MGQGRKRIERQDNRRNRRRSISLDVDNLDNNTLLYYMGSAAVIRSRMEATCHSNASKRCPTPFPTRGFREAGQATHSHPVPGYPTEEQACLTCGKERNPSPTNVCMNPDSIPFVPTISLDPASSGVRDNNYYIAEYMTRTFFRENFIVQNERKQELSVENRRKIRSILKDLLDAEHNTQPLSSIVSKGSGSRLVPSRSFLHHLLSLPRPPSVSFFSSSLQLSPRAPLRRLREHRHHRSLSLRSALLPALPAEAALRVPPGLPRAGARERLAAGRGPLRAEHSLRPNPPPRRALDLASPRFLSPFSPLQTHYAAYCSALYAHAASLRPGDEVPGLSPRFLADSLLLLLRIRGVASKYRPLLLEGMLKLFYTSRAALARCLRALAAKWPIGNPRKVRVFGGCEVDARLAGTDAGSAAAMPSFESARAGERGGRAAATRGRRSQGHAGRLLLAGAGDSGGFALPFGVRFGASEADSRAAGESAGDS